MTSSAGCQVDVLGQLRSWGFQAEVAGDLYVVDLKGFRAEFAAGLLCRSGFKATAVDSQLRLADSASEGLSKALKRALRPDLLCLDIDGCLIDTRASFDNVVKTLVLQLQGQPVSDEEIKAIRREGGFNDDNVLVYEVIRRRGGNTPLAEILPIFRDLYIGTAEKQGFYRQETPIINQPFLDSLRDRFPVALVTGRNREEGVLAMELLGLSEMPMWTVDDVAQGKPDPQGILEAAALFKAQDVWMVGDNVDDILAGLRAGAVAIGVGRYRDILLEAGADWVLDDINGLEVLL